MFQITLRTTFKPSVLVEGSASPIAIQVWVNSSNPEDSLTTSNNHVSFTIPVIVETDIILRGLADPQPLQHNVSNYELLKYKSEEEDGFRGGFASLRESDIGPEVTHIYQVENKGPSDVIEARVYVLWPSFRPNGDPLLYLTYQPVVEGKGRCEFVADVNPFQVLVRETIKFDRQVILATKSFLATLFLCQG